MPLQKIIISDSSKLYLWKITETVAELLSLFSAKIPEKYLRFNSPEHQAQFLAKELLLRYLKIDKQLDYLDSGKPVLRNGAYISVSHSRNWVGIALSSQEIGMDMEFANPKLIKIASKFVHPSEHEILDVNNVMDLQFLWTAKESIYKLAGQKGLRFKEDIILQNFDREKLQAEFLLFMNTLLKIVYHKLDGDFITARAVYDK